MAPEGLVIPLGAYLYLNNMYSIYPNKENKNGTLYLQMGYSTRKSRRIC